MRGAILLLMVAACGDDGGNGGQDAAGGSVAAVAHALHGAAVPVNARLAAPIPAPATDGKWYVTPNKVKLTLERINFERMGGGMTVGADLTNCVVMFDKATPSLSNLLDCPFSIPPGTYLGMTLFVGGTYEVLIDDATNGFYTDPAAPSKLSTTAPSGGAQFITYTRPLGGGGAQQQFLAPVTVNEGDTLSLNIVLDAIHTVHVQVSGTSLSFVDPDQVPVNVFPTLQKPGVARYLTTANTADSYNDSLVLANIMRAYYGSDGQPLYAFPEQTAGMINQCSTPAPAYPTDPAMSTPLNDGSRLGGWLGRDSTQTTCWVVPNDKAVTTYRAYFTLGNATTVGDMATLSCQKTTSPTPPSSGSTYAAGCPPITPDATANLQLVAQ